MSLGCVPSRCDTKLVFALLTELMASALLKNAYKNSHLLDCDHLPPTVRHLSWFVAQGGVNRLQVICTFDHCLTAFEAKDGKSPCLKTTDLLEQVHDAIHRAHTTIQPIVRIGLPPFFPSTYRHTGYWCLYSCILVPFVGVSPPNFIFAVCSLAFELFYSIDYFSLPLVIAGVYVLSTLGTSVLPFLSVLYLGYHFMCDMTHGIHRSKWDETSWFFSRDLLFDRSLKWSCL